MASLAGTPPTPWPRMHSGQKNPFQNAPGPFIYALPNLAGTCSLSSSDTVLSSSFAADSTTAPHRYHCYHHPALNSRCHQHPPPESEEPSPTEQRADPESSSAQSPLDESHFDLDDIISPSSLTEVGTELCSRQEQQEQQEEERSEPSTPTQSHTLSSPSPIGSEFPEATKDLEDEHEKEEGEGEEKRGRRCRKRRRRAKGRQLLEHGGCVMGPRVMGLSGLHFDRWTRYVCPPPLALPPPPSAAMSNHAWVLTAGYNGFVPPNSPALFWDRVPGFVGVPSW